MHTPVALVPMYIQTTIRAQGTVWRVFHARTAGLIRNIKIREVLIRYIL